MSHQVRIDKWLWAVRLFKTRSIATEACKKGRVLIDKSPAKPSKMIKIGDVVQVKRPPITYQFKVLDLIEKRIGAKLTSEYIEDITPDSELAMLEMQKGMVWMQRDKGAGRPTKKDRRDIDDFFDENSWEDL